MHNVIRNFQFQYNSQHTSLKSLKHSSNVSSQREIFLQYFSASKLR